MIKMTRDEFVKDLELKAKTTTHIKERAQKLFDKLEPILNEEDKRTAKECLVEFDFPKEKLDEFASLLDKMSLSAMITTMKEVENRLSFLEELKRIVYSEDGKYVKERTQFQPLLISQLWIFGDKYVYGVDDVSLKNVLREYSKEIGIDNFELTDEDLANTELDKIPDIVLWRKVCLGENYENLVVEIKKPHKVIGSAEIEQIKKYRNSIINHSGFSSNDYKWRFVLIGKELDEYAKGEIESQPDGVITLKNSKLEILTWSSLISRNELKYEFFKKETEKTYKESEIEDALNKRWDDLFDKGLIKEKPKEWLLDKLFQQALWEWYCMCGGEKNESKEEYDLLKKIRGLKSWKYLCENGHVDIPTPKKK